MKFPTYEEMAQNVAEKALDEYEYKGRTIRQWIEIIYNSEHGTNLAEVGTDCISREAVLNEFCHLCDGWSCNPNTCCKTEWIRKLPPIQPAEPKRGKWHYSDGKPATIGLSFGVICDQCGTESEYCTNFCGECGADMRQKGENSESN